MVDGTNSAPDVVIVAMLPGNATEAILTYRQAGYTLPILSNNSFRRDYILRQVGAAANGGHDGEGDSCTHPTDSHTHAPQGIPSGIHVSGFIH